MTLILIIGIFLLAVFAFVAYRSLKVKRQSKKLSAQKFDRINPLYGKLENGQDLTKEDILPFAQNFLTRELTYKLLKKA